MLRHQPPERHQQVSEPLSTESPCRVKSGSLSFAETPKPAEPDFYSTLWSLQQYFASPPTLDGPPTGEPPHTPFDDFKTKSDFVLPRLFEQTRRENEIMGKDTEMVGSKRKRDVDDGGFFHPRYLTGKRLLEHEVGPGLDLGLVQTLRAEVEPLYAGMTMGERALMPSARGPFLPPSDPSPILHPLPVPAQPDARVRLQTSFHRWHAQDVRARLGQRGLGQRQGRDDQGRAAEDGPGWNEI
jgi:hypothetical protein